ncbi:hypothetical protein Barb7_02955 [Bacteroidales bacterium Barb7]|nr:hypothetical protein Barb7_02955 [Bacteroidales bacterium Barb7]
MPGQIAKHTVGHMFHIYNDAFYTGRQFRIVNRIVLAVKFYLVCPDGQCLDVFYKLIVVYRSFFCAHVYGIQYAGV